MKKKYLRVLFLTAILSFLVSQTNILVNLSKKYSTAYAVGDLTIDWGVPSGEPIFVIDNFLPGDKAEKKVQVLNGAATIRPVGIKGIKTSETGNLAEALIITIFENDNIIFGPKNLTAFFEESNTPTGIFLTNIAPSTSTKYNFEVTFNPDAGNNLQGTSVVFDIIIGISVPVPEECQGIKFSGSPIFGTQGNDNLKGGNGNDLIFSFEGNDKINGSNGDDCIVGGPGNDRLYGSNGNDIIFGNEGNDKINGGNGNDKIYDAEGDSLVDGGNGNDIISGSPGNDTIKGGNGSDKIYGKEGDDRLYGGNGNDFLAGDEGEDFANGGLGKDQCETETKIRCEKDNEDNNFSFLEMLFKNIRARLPI